MQEKYQALDNERCVRTQRTRTRKRAPERVHSRVHTRAHRMKMDQENSGLKEQLATKKAENDREVTRAAVQ